MWEKRVEPREAKHTVRFSGNRHGEQDEDGERCDAEAGGNSQRRCGGDNGKDEDEDEDKDGADEDEALKGGPEVG